MIPATGPCSESIWWRCNGLNVRSRSPSKVHGMCGSGVIGVVSPLVSRDADDDGQDTGSGGRTRALAQATRALRVITTTVMRARLTGKTASRSFHGVSKRSVGDNDNLNGFTEHLESIQIIVGIAFPVTLLSLPEQQLHGKQHETIFLEFMSLFVAGYSNCPQGMLLSSQPPRPRHKPCRLIKVSSQLVGIQQVRTARVGILGSPPSRIACVGHALTLRPEGGACQVHTRNENHGLVPPTLHPSNRRVSRKIACTIES